MVKRLPEERINHTTGLSSLLARFLGVASGYMRKTQGKMTFFFVREKMSQGVRGGGRVKNNGKGLLFRRLSRFLDVARAGGSQALDEFFKPFCVGFDVVSKPFINSRQLFQALLIGA